jgi:hypothetical protein
LLRNIVFALVGEGDPTIRGIEQNGSLQCTARRRREFETLSGSISAFRRGRHGFLPIQDFCSRRVGMLELASSAANNSLRTSADAAMFASK